MGGGGTYRPRLPEARRESPGAAAAGARQEWLGGRPGAPGVAGRPPGRLGDYDAWLLSGSGAPSGAVAAEAGTAEGLTNVLPPGPAWTTSPVALPFR